MTLERTVLLFALASELRFRWGLSGQLAKLWACWLCRVEPVLE